MNRQPWDHGLQVERTALAWIRTSASLVVVALIAFRFAAHYSLELALVLLAVITGLGVAAGWFAWRRYRTSDDRLNKGTPLPGGGLALIATVMTVVTGLLGLVYVLARAI